MQLAKELLWFLRQRIEKGGRRNLKSSVFRSKSTKSSEEQKAKKRLTGPQMTNFPPKREKQKSKKVFPAQSQLKNKKKGHHALM